MPIISPVLFILSAIILLSGNGYDATGFFLFGMLFGVAELLLPKIMKGDK